MVWVSCWPTAVTRLSGCLLHLLVEVIQRFSAVRKPSTKAKNDGGIRDTRQALQTSDYRVCCRIDQAGFGKRYLHCLTAELIAVRRARGYIDDAQPAVLGAALVAPA